MDYYLTADLDEGFEISSKSREGGTAWQRILHHDHRGQAHVVLWKAEPGTYGSVPPPPYSESFVVLSGEGSVAIGGQPERSIGPGSIVHMPLGAGMVLKVGEGFRKLSTVVLSEPAAG